MTEADPFARLKLFVGYTVAVFWAIMLLVLLALPARSRDLALAIAGVQAAMMLVAGSLFAVGRIRRNGGGDKT